jgi:peptide/nickel transport system permease protein
VVGALIVAGVVAVAVLAPHLAPRDPLETSLDSRLRPPFWSAQTLPGRLLGTDQLGRDLLSRIVFGARVSLLVAGAAVAGALVAGVGLGLLAGYRGGWVDQLVMRVVDVQSAFPFILLAIFVLAVLRPTLVNVIAVLALSSWGLYCRLVRAQTLSIREREFVAAARALGCRPSRVLLLHVLPAQLAGIAVVATFQTAQVIVTESVLSFLGLGIQPPTPTWGLAIGEGREYVSLAWWMIAFPGLALMLTVVGLGLMGEAMRVRLSPGLRDQ